MYLEFYGLDREPFHITPDPYFFYLSPSHKEAFASMVYGLKNKKGFMALTGEVGLGKTTVMRTFLEQWAKKKQIKTVFIFNTDISFPGLLKVILEEMGSEVPSGLTKGEPPVSGMQEKEAVAELVQQLHKLLIQDYKAGQNVILIIDEAQNMPVATLERLRMLSNLETATSKLLQIFLIGQPELDATLNKKELRQLRQRIAVRSRLKPLSRKETIRYIASRLEKAGGQAKAVFKPRALERIYCYSKGIPRHVNILCDNALITGFGLGKKRITPRIIREVQADLQGRKPRRILRKLAYALLAGCLLLAALGWFSPYKAPILNAVQTQPTLARLLDWSASLVQAPPEESPDPVPEAPAVESPRAEGQEGEPVPPETAGEEPVGSPAPEVLSSKANSTDIKTRSNASAPGAAVFEKRYPVFATQKPAYPTPLAPSQKQAAPPSPESTGQTAGSAEEPEETEAEDPLPEVQAEARGGDAPEPSLASAGAVGPSPSFYSQLNNQDKILYTKLALQIPVFLQLSSARQAVLIAMARQLTVDGLLTFEKMLAALQAGDFEEAARQIVNSRWAARASEEAEELAERMRSGGGETVNR